MNPYKVHVYRQPPHITASLLKRCSRRVCRCSSSSRAPQVTIGFNTQLKSGWWCNNHLGKHEFVNGKDDNPYIYISWKIKFMFQTTNQEIWLGSFGGEFLGNHRVFRCIPPDVPGRNEMERWHQNLLPSSFEELFLAHFVSDFGNINPR